MMPADGQVRREAIAPEDFVKVMTHLPELTHAVCGPPTPAGVDELRHHITAASGGTPDGRWMVGDVLVTCLGENLERRGVRGAAQIMAYIVPFGVAPVEFSGSAVGESFKAEMAKARQFVEATLREDFDAAMSLTDENGDRLLFVLASLVAATCPVHRPVTGAV